VAPALHSLNICERNDVVRILKILFDSPVDIRKLNLKRCNPGKDRDNILTTIVDLCPDLEALSLENCDGIKGYSLISRLKKLSELNLSDIYVSVRSRTSLDIHFYI
jgi:hypothetical protein